MPSHHLVALHPLLLVFSDAELERDFRRHRSQSLRQLDLAVYKLFIFFNIIWNTAAVMGVGGGGQKTFFVSCLYNVAMIGHGTSLWWMGRTQRPEKRTHIMATLQLVYHFTSFFFILAHFCPCSLTGGDSYTPLSPTEQAAAFGRLLRCMVASSGVIALPFFATGLHLTVFAEQLLVLPVAFGLYILSPLHADVCTAVAANTAASAHVTRAWQLCNEGEGSKRPPLLSNLLPISQT